MLYMIPVPLENGDQEFSPALRSAPSSPALSEKSPKSPKAKIQNKRLEKVSEPAHAFPVSQTFIVHMMCGRTLSFAAHDSQRVCEARQVLEQDLGLQRGMHGISLVLGSRELEDDETLASAGWEADSLVLGVVRLSPSKQAAALQSSVESLRERASGLERRKALAVLQYFAKMHTVAAVHTRVLVQCLELESLNVGTTNFTRPIRVAAARALARVDGPPLPRAEQLRSRLWEESIRPELIEALGDLAARHADALDIDIVTDLAYYLGDGCSRVRRAAVQSLQSIGLLTPGVVSGLAAALAADRDVSVRKETAEALGMLGASAASAANAGHAEGASVEAVAEALEVSMLTDSDEGVRQAAAAAHARVSGRQSELSR